MYRLSYQRLDHVGLAVAKRFDSIEDVHHVLVLDHLKENVAGTEGPTATTAVTAKGQTCFLVSLNLNFFIFSVF